MHLHIDAGHMLLQQLDSIVSSHAKCCFEAFNSSYDSALFCPGLSLVAVLGLLPIVAMIIDQVPNVWVC